jgi:hypothetical protein
MQFGQGASAKLQRKCLSTTAFEDEDDEHEDEAHCERACTLRGACPGARFRSPQAIFSSRVPRLCKIVPFKLTRMRQRGAISLLAPPG